MRTRLLDVVIAVFVSVVLGQIADARADSSCFVPLKTDGGLDLFLWTDVCNVYVLREGDAAILIDIGDGSVLEHLGELGIHKLEWVLLTHHHREQCQGHLKLRSWHPKVAAPQKERAFFERPTDFRKMRPSFSDAFTIYATSYVRPPVQPLAIQRELKFRDVFTWRGHEFWCLQTAGNSPGSMSYLIKTERGWIAFSGDVMLAGGRMHNWFDSEWDYGFATGLYALIESTARLESFEPALLLPSHGPVIRAPTAELHAYQQKLRQLARLYVRGYKIFTFAPADQDRVSRPSVVPHLWQLTKHLFKFKSDGATYQPNFTLLLADTGRALMIDCGCLDKTDLDATLDMAKQRLGLKGIDAILITHMHDDHIVGAPKVREKWGAKIWTLDRVAEKFEQPWRFDYTCSIAAHGPKFAAVHIDRTFKSGESFSWEGYQLTVDWMPGQTEFACCIHGKIDGRLIAFTGDNILAAPDDPTQDGHEAVVARNSAIFEEGYIYGADYLRQLQPDLIVGGHSYVMDRPKDLIQRYHDWAVSIRGVYQSLSAEPDYRYMFDPYWVRVDPYRLNLPSGGSAAVVVRIRNFLDRPRTYRLAVHCPNGIVAEPAVLEGRIEPAARIQLPLRLKASSDVKRGVQLVALDTTLDDQRYGEWFDFIVGDNADQGSKKRSQD
jgi:glyoxylase-like metal-dependent hydrolase (beta-lactamase superfamily II)